MKIRITPSQDTLQQEAGMVRCWVSKDNGEVVTCFMANGFLEALDRVKQYVPVEDLTFHDLLPSF